MSNRKKFVTINGTKHYLNHNGEIETFDTLILSSWAISHLGLEVETEGPRFEDIKPGIYSPHGRVGNLVYKKRENDTWTDGNGHEVENESVERLERWHKEGVLYRLNKGEATNA